MQCLNLLWGALPPGEDVCYSIVNPTDMTETRIYVINSSDIPDVASTGCQEGVTRHARVKDRDYCLVVTQEPFSSSSGYKTNAMPEVHLSFQDGLLSSSCSLFQ